MDRLGMIQGPALRLEVSLHPIHSAETHYEPARELWSFTSPTGRASTRSAPLTRSSL